MAYCVPGRLARSEFLGWPQPDRDGALLYQQHQAQIHAPCGTHPDDWDPAKGGHVAAFVATVIDCPGCAAVAAREKRLAKEIEKGKYSSSAYVALRRQVERRTDVDPGDSVGRPADASVCGELAG